MKILVTGALGQLGQTFRSASEGWENEIHLTDVNPSEDGVLPLDITDPSAVSDFLSGKQIDVILNFAGYTDVERAESEESDAFRVNSQAVEILAGEAAARNILLVHISTDYVFDGMASVPYGEEAATAPLSAYGRSKLAGELAVFASGCPYIIIRTSWLYSPFGRNFVKTILSRSAEQPVLKVVSDQIGTPTYAGDLVEFIIHMLDNEPYAHQGIYNYTNEGVCSWYDLAWEICHQSGALCDVVPCRTGEFPVKAQRPHYSVLDKTKVKQTYAIEIPHWKDSLNFCLSQL